jgi:hypothetical protein
VHLHHNSIHGKEDALNPTRHASPATDSDMRLE